MADTQLTAAHFSFAALSADSRVHTLPSIFWPDFAQSHAYRSQLSVSIESALTQLDQINPATFRFMSLSQKAFTMQHLQFILYILCSYYELNKKEHRRQGLRKIKQQAERAHELLCKIQRAPKEDIDTPLKDALAQTPMSLKYIGLRIGRAIAEAYLSFAEGKSIAFLGAINKVNEERLLQGAWGGMLLSTTMGLWVNQVGPAPIAEHMLKTQQVSFGYMSWILYYARFGTHLTLLLKHTIAGPWMSEKEKLTPAWERFTTQWEHRKFILINDFFWSGGNLAGFYWLVGQGTLGYFGNVATAALLVLDIGLSTWQLIAETTKYNQQMLRYKADLQEINKKIAAAEANNAGLQELRLRLAAAKEEEECLRLEQEISKQIEQDETLYILNKHKRELEQSMLRYQIAWKYKKYNLIITLAYSISLLLSFSIFSAMFIPSAALVPLASTILGITGAVLCFSLSIIYAAVSGSLEIAQLNTNAKLRKDELALHFQEFQDPHKTSDEKKLCYLEITRLQAFSLHDEESIRFQKMQLIHKILMNSVLPILLFSSLVLLPSHIGTPALAGAIAVLIISKIILTLIFKPKTDTGMPSFDEAAFNRFLAQHPPRTKPPGLFSGAPEPSPEPEEVQPLLPGQAPR